MKIDFSGKVALVTGGGRGIGRAICQEFAMTGARVVCVDINQELGEETISLVKKQGAEGKFIRADVTDATDVESYVNQTVARFGRIDAFSNNAGWQGAVESIIEYPEDVFDKVMSINVKGVFLGLKYVLPQMIQQQSGAVVNTASRAGLVGAPEYSGYIASKHAVIGLTKTAALEVARQGVRVNAVCPGSVDTELLRNLKHSSAENVETFLSERANLVPDGRLGKASEVARQVIYLASDFSSHVTGQSLAIDGGALAM
ncbi:glucose 1-dehydrogenase [Alteribacillus sp. YIM 98480]|uniref:glucose 1-dehydrogenase n=1 Tax=Alteribacillus sp. YIM 98480 TaxID=2606599 RepID=UPI00131B2C68|nr:glucose 1-dehydrogenase [Alteribacillus sp. YIM 98480]